MSTNFFNKLKTKLLTVMLVLCLVSTVALGLVACKDKDVTEKDPSYSFSQNTTTTSNENNFNFSNSINLDTDAFPASATAWSVSVDNSAISSSVKSGVVNTSSEGWKKIVSALSDDSEFLDYVKKNKNVTSDEDAKALIGKDGYFTAPTRTGTTDNYVYMINNYREKNYAGVGTAQKVASSNTIVLDKNSTYKVGVWVNTQNLKSKNLDNFGANVRLINTFNGSNQANFAIENINTNGKWEQYFIYVKSDENYNCTLSVTLGLGYGNGANNLTKDYVEGTVYFDDITCEKLDNKNVATETADILTENQKSLVFGQTEKYIVNNAIKSLYKMEFDTTLASFFDNNGSALDYTPTSSLFTTALDGAVTSKTICDAKGVTSEITANATSESIELTLTKASATYTLPVVATLDAEKYAVVNFKIKNALSNFGSTDIVIDIWDVYKGLKVKRAAVASFSKSSEDFVDCTLYIKNNFEGVNGRTFLVDVVIGPSKVAEVERANDFASGVVTIKDLRYTVGNINDVKDDKVAGFFTSSPSATVSLYAGYTNEFDASASETSYSFTEAPGNIGTITSHPSNPAGYDGVVANHAYVSKTEDAVTTINTRSGENGTAGLINSKYYANYGVTLDELGNPEKDIQPLMIRNANDDSYGFISKKTISLSASAIASFSVKVRVVGQNAKAFIYLVNAEKANKEILSFDDFKVNTNVVKDVAVGTEVKGSERLFAIEVTENMCNEDGWATVSFFIVNGKNEKQVRLELWNGSRTGDVKSKGLVFFDEVNTTASSAFTKSEKWNETFTVSGNPLYDQTLASYDNGELYAYKRTLTEDESNFNAEYPDKAVEYFTTYVWAKNSLSVFADYSTLDGTKVISNPYDSITEDKEEGSGCAAKTDPSTFWMSFSTIVLIVALVLAMAALILKGVIRKRKANASDAKSHYKVTSRIKKDVSETKSKFNFSLKKKAKAVSEETTKDVEVKDETTEDETTETVETTEVETVETTDTETETEETSKNTEETDGYVYGDVIEDFTIENPESTENEETKNDDGENK